jgi:hypothetical protein
MTLPASGNPISISQINTEFSLGNSLSAYRGVTWYTDAGATGTFSAGAISMSEFYSKRVNSPFTPSLSQLQSVWIVSSWSSPTSLTLLMSSNGTWTGVGSEGNVATGNWGTPTTSGIGSSYWIRFTRTAQDIPSGGQSSSASTGWLSLSTAQQVTVYNPASGGTFSATYSIQISTDSGGSTIVASCTGCQLTAFVEVI